MGSTFLSDVIAGIVAVFLLFVGPIYAAYQQMDFICDSTAKNAVSYLQKEVRKNGYIDSETYRKFLNELNKSGRVYKVSLTHTSKLIYPATKQGECTQYNIDYGTEQILKKIKTSKYTMKYGDDFSVKITETEVSTSRMLQSAFSSRPTLTKMSYYGGGMVENEVNG